MFGKIYDIVMRFLYGRKIRRLFFLETVKHLNPFDWHRLNRVWNTYKKVRLDFDREDILKVANCLPQGGLMLGEIVLEECADIIRHKFLKLTNQYDMLVSKTKGKFVDLILYLRFLNYDEFLQIRE